MIAFDLFGHGESQSDFVFGAKEHELYTKILGDINANEAITKPIVTVGHSMGGVPAANVLSESELVDGAILLAPMIRFDQAAKLYLSYKSPMLNGVLSNDMDDIVSKAMATKNIDPQSTDISLTIANTRKPVLIVNSDVDTVSPIDKFSNLKSEFIQQKIFKGRSHPSLIAFDNDDAKFVESWILDNFPVVSK